MMASISNPLTASGVAALLSLTRRLRSSSKCCVAATPASAISRAASSSSYRSSSIRVPVNTCAMDEPVLRRPVRRRSIQERRSGLAWGWTTAMSLDVGALAGATAWLASEAGAGCAAAGGCGEAATGFDGAGALLGSVAGRGVAAGGASGLSAGASLLPQPSFFLMKLNMPRL